MPTALIRSLFPHTPRCFPGQRWVNIGLRSAHLIGVAGIAAGFLFTLDQELWLPYWHLTLATGIVLSILYVWSTAAWLFELRGLTIVLKIVLLAAARLVPDARGELFVLVIALSSLTAHAPARVRAYRWLGLPDRGDRNP